MAPTQHPDRLSPLSDWARTALECVLCGAATRRNRITGVEWCPECDHEFPARPAGPSVPAACSVPDPPPAQPPQDLSQEHRPPADGQPSWCARCATLGFEIVSYDNAQMTEPRRVGLVHDPRIAETCARALNLARIAWQKFPAYSSRAVRG